MCYFFGLQVNTEKNLTLEPFGIRLSDSGTIASCRSGFEYAQWPVLFRHEQSGKIEAGNFHWEFIPAWIADEDALIAARKKGVPWLNARGETLLRSKMFGPAARKRRCLIPVTHFFEWRHYKQQGAAKPMAYPYVIGMKDKSVFYLAGIWQNWTDRSTGEIIGTFAVVTTAANSLMRLIHNTKERQPTLFDSEKAKEWLDESLNEQQIEEIANYQVPEEKLDAYTVNKDFRLSANPIAAFQYPGLPPLIL
jgi:putative SOS response-associated peptidase YedK